MPRPSESPLFLEALSPTATSCLFTKGASQPYDKRQKVKASYQMPNSETRLLLAQLIMEEAIETCIALGYTPHSMVGADHMTHIRDVGFREDDKKLSILEAVDGACDTIYVATGALVAMGVPDTPHLKEVCRTNDAKFPGGVATIDPVTGKYQKPDGWTPPRHDKVMGLFKSRTDMVAATRTILQRRQE